jgi:hypothetical protein
MNIIENSRKYSFHFLGLWCRWGWCTSIF